MESVQSVHDFPGIVELARLVGQHHMRWEPAAGAAVEEFLSWWAVVGERHPPGHDLDVDAVFVHRSCSTSTALYGEC